MCKVWRSFLLTLLVVGCLSGGRAALLWAQAEQTAHRLYLPWVTTDDQRVPGETAVDETDLDNNVRLLATTPLYAGPGTDEYPLLATLEIESVVTPLAFWGDFVKVQSVTAAGRQEGYLPRTALANLPADLQPLAAATAPWRQQTVVPAGYPLHFDLVLPNYQQYPIFGSATSAAADLTIDVTLRITRTASATAEASNGLWLGRLEKRIILTHQWGSWHLLGDNLAFPMPQLTQHQIRFRLKLSQNNRRIDLTLPTGETHQVDLAESYFAAQETLYLGVQTGPGSQVSVLNLSLSQAPTGNADAILGSAPPLQDAFAQHQLDFGTLPDGGWYGSVLDHRLFARHANQVIWVPTWDEATNLVHGTRLAFANVHGMKAFGNALIYHLLYPDWLKNGSFTPDQLRQIMHTQITNHMQRYPADLWVVVNEAVTDDGSNNGFYNEVFYRAFGEEYLDLAFRIARAADPDAVLLYGDYWLEYDTPKADRIYQLLQRMLARGVPIDAIGMQFHLQGCQPSHQPTKAEFLRQMERFAGLGLDIYITELDVNLRSWSGSQAEKWAKQAEFYRDAVEACLATTACKSINTWGFRDGASWWYDNQQCGEDPLLFDNNYQPKPAFFAMVNALNTFKRVAIQATQKAPVIDGKIDTLWKNTPGQPIQQLLLGTPPTAADLAGSFKARYDNTHLYLLVTVSDEAKRNDAGSDWWEDDAIEIYLDGDKSRGNSYDGANDYQLVFRWNDPKLNSGPNSKPAPAGLRWRRANTSNGYRLEVAIPLAAVGINPVAGAEFGLDLHVIDDDDGGARENKLAWNAAADEAWRNPGYFGVAVLQDATPSDWVATLPTAAQTSILWHGDVEEGTLFDWTDEGAQYPGGGIFNTGEPEVFARAAAAVSHSGRFAAEATITNAYRAQNGNRAVRLFRWTDRPWDAGGKPFPTDAYYSTWLYFPTTYNPNKYAPWDPGDGGWWNLFQFKSKDANGMSQSVWSLNLAYDDTANTMYFYFYTHQNTPPLYQQATPRPIPVGRWVHLEARYRQHAGDQGLLQFWQDGVMIFDIAHVKTILAEPADWSINNYTDHIAGGAVEGTATVYFDDAVVSRRPLHPYIQQ